MGAPDRGAPSHNAKPEAARTTSGHHSQVSESIARARNQLRTSEMHRYTITTARRKLVANPRRSLRRHGPRYVYARRSRRMTVVWTLRLRHLIDGVIR